MTRISAWGFRAFAAVAALCACATAQAQTVADPGAAAEPRPIPVFTIGVGGGTPWGESGRAVALTIQLPTGRWFAVEGEITARQPGRFPMRTVTAGVNALARAGSRRVIAFAGGGVGLQRTANSSFYAESGVALQVVGGVDVPIGRHLLAYGAVRAGTAPEDGVRAFTGLRLPIGARDASWPAGPPADPLERGRAAVGKDVRVTAVDGSKQTGKIVSLSATTVILRQDGRDVSIALAGVRRIEKVSHGVRNGAIAGAVATAWPWTTVATTRDTCADCEDGPAMATLMTPIFVGIGAGIGAITNVIRADSNLIYERPGSSPRITVAPMLGRERRGVRATVRW